jgi:hypothetical protein
MPSNVTVSGAATTEDVTRFGENQESTNAVIVATGRKPLFSASFT